MFSFSFRRLGFTQKTTEVPVTEMVPVFSGVGFMEDLCPSFGFLSQVLGGGGGGMFWYGVGALFREDSYVH